MIAPSQHQESQPSSQVPSNSPTADGVVSQEPNTVQKTSQSTGEGSTASQSRPSNKPADPVVTSQSGTVTSKSGIDPLELDPQADVKDDEKKYPGLYDEQPAKQYQSKTNRVVATELQLADVAILKGSDGSISLVERTALADKYGEIKTKRRIKGPNGVVEVVVTPKDEVIVFDGSSTRSFENKDQAAAAGYEFL